MRVRVCLIGLVGVALGCGQAPIADPVAVERRPDARYLLAEEPDDALGVIELRDDAADGQRVTVVGRIGGGVNPWVTGKAAFVLVDAAAGECGGGGCTDPGCDCKAIELADSIVVVKFLDAAGKLLATPAQSLLGVDALETVVVEGTARRDKSGNVTLVAEGVYVRR